jgi:formylglycine-generating enzyme required for sulfatase activity
MKGDPSATAAAFAKALRSFQPGTTAVDNVVGQLREWLAAGIPAGELLGLLSLRESIEVLPSAVHRAAVSFLRHQSDVRPPDSAEAESSSSDGIIPSEDPTVVLEEAWRDASPTEATDESPPPVTPNPALVGDVLLGHYYLIEVIGEGGMSRVYRAIDTERRLEDPYVAVKVLTRAGDPNDAVHAQFRAEFDKLRNLVHPNIVRVLDYASHGESMFIVMEYVVGQSLYTRLHKPSATPSPTLTIDRATAISIVHSIGDALIYAHAHGIVHGDLKPGNVIVSDAGHVKVIDFAQATWMAQPVVTPRYASPQQLARQTPGPSDDLFALGCLTYELLTGSQPFSDSSGERSPRFPPPPGDLSSNHYSAITHALAFQRSDRTPTIQQFLKELDACPLASTRGSRGVWAAGVALLIVLAGYYAYRTRKTEIVPQPPAPDNATVSAPATTRNAGTSGPTVDAAGSRILDCPDCPPLTVLPKGQFDQGSESSASIHEKPQHRVTIGYQVAVAVNDVTVGNFARFVAATGRNMKGCDIYDGQWHHKATADWQQPGFAQSPEHPVVCTSWNDAVAYTQWLSTVTGHHYRLPSAAEWEFAARAGSAQDVPWGSDTQRACTQANVADQSAAARYPGWQVFACNDGFANTSPVGSFKANPFGLNDTLGNVFQWTQDCWYTDYAGAPADGSARDDATCTDRELRGGSWFSSPDYVRTSYRNHFAADYRTSSVGFRVVRDLGP